jgi:hypothetical protein
MCNVCILLDLFVQIMWQGSQCSALGWEPSPVHWISKATLLIKCYSRPHLLRMNRHCFPTSSPLCKITHSELLRLMINFVVCPTAPHCRSPIPSRKLETGMLYVGDAHKTVSPILEVYRQNLLPCTGSQFRPANRRRDSIFIRDCGPNLSSFWILLGGLNRHEDVWEQGVGG